MPAEARDEAWAVRETERSEFLRELFGEAREAEESSDRPFLLHLIKAIVDYMLGDVNQANPATGFLLNKVLLDIKDFSRSRTEAEALLAMLLRKHIVPAMLIERLTALEREETDKPELIFQAPSAMHEAPFPRE